MKLKFLSNPNWIIIFYLSVTVTKIIVILVPLVETPCEQTCLCLCNFLTIFSFSWDIHRIFFETFLLSQKIAPILAPLPLNFNNENFQELCTIKKYKKCNLENYMNLLGFLNYAPIGLEFSSIGSQRISPGDSFGGISIFDLFMQIISCQKCQFSQPLKSDMKQMSPLETSFENTLPLFCHQSAHD